MDYQKHSEHTIFDTTQTRSKRSSAYRFCCVIYYLFFGDNSLVHYSCSLPFKVNVMKLKVFTYFQSGKCLSSKTN